MVIPADLAIDQELIHTLIAEQCGLAPTHLSLLGEGFDNVVYLVDHQWVFRFPRRKRAIPMLEREIAILPALQGLSLNTPMPTYVGKPSAPYESPFYGHQYLPGNTGCATTLTLTEYRRAARDLGVFLKQLHYIDPAQLGLNHQNFAPTFDRADFPRLLELFKTRWEPACATYALQKYQQKVEEICAAAEENKPPLPGATFVHGDLYHRHLLFDDRHRLTAVIDWGDMGLSDASVDLGVLFQFFPASVHDDFFATYGDVSEQRIIYARFIGLYYAVVLLWYGHDRKDQDLVRTSLASLAAI
jgi:aminoglycoside phosphotransferase (APT) family kinase protein